MEDKNDLTQGPIVKKLMLFFLPIAAGTLFQQLYNAVDAFVVGKYVGTWALAAVGGSPAVVSQLIIGFCTALASGAAVVISQLHGAREHEHVTKAVHNSYLFCMLLGVAVGAAMVFLSPQILTLLKTSPEAYDDALLYQRIYFTGTLFILLFNMGSGILRAVGDSRFPFLCLGVSCFFNIGLDLLFVIRFGMGVAGVGWATVIAQGVSAVMVTVKLLVVKQPHRLRFSRNLLDLRLLKKMLRIGIPAGLQSSMYGVSNAVLQIGINTLGTLVTASWAMSGKIDGAYWAISSAFGAAITTFVGQNYGAGDYKRVRESAKKGMLLFLGITVFMSAVTLSAGQFLLNLFSDDPAVVDTTWYIMLFFVPVYVLWSAIEVFTGVLRGTGDALMPSIILAVGICGFRVAWVLTAFAFFPTLACICICYPASWAVTDIAIVCYYRKKSLIAKKA